MTIADIHVIIIIIMGTVFIKCRHPPRLHVGAQGAVHRYYPCSFGKCNNVNVHVCTFTSAGQSMYTLFKAAFLKKWVPLL